MSPLDTFPEELLESILAYVVFSKPVSHLRSPLRLVSKGFHRISTPLYFHTIHLRSPAQLHKLLDIALRPNPHLASHICKIIIEGVWAEAGELFNLCRPFGALKILDITLDVPTPPDELVKFVFSSFGMPTNNVRINIAGTSDDEDFCKHLDELTSVTHLTVRKPSHVYLTQKKTQLVLSKLAGAIKVWKGLEYVNLAFRLSDDSGTHPDPHPLVKSSFVAPSIATVPPLTRLTHVLSTLPNLRTFVTRLPNVWSQNILRVSRNPALEKIVLEDLALPFPPTGSGPENVYDYGIQGTGLFFKEAKKYPRLCELIRAGLGFGFPGSPTTRTQAQTLDTPDWLTSSSNQIYVYNCNSIVVTQERSRHNYNHHRSSSTIQSSWAPPLHHSSPSASWWSTGGSLGYTRSKVAVTYHHDHDQRPSSTAQSSSAPDQRRSSASASWWRPISSLVSQLGALSWQNPVSPGASQRKRNGTDAARRHTQVEPPPTSSCSCSSCPCSSSSSSFFSASSSGHP